MSRALTGGGCLNHTVYRWAFGPGGHNGGPGHVLKGRGNESPDAHLPNDTVRLPASDLRLLNCPGLSGLGAF